MARFPLLSRELLTGRRSPQCGLCRHDRASLRYRVEPRLVWQCEQCRVLFSTDLSGQARASGPPQDDDFSHITDSGAPYLESGPYFIARYQPLLEGLEAWRAPGRLLDIGCGPGFFLEAARPRGWEPVGLDPSRFAADYAARTYGLKVICAPLEEAALAPASFDAVALIHALEHFADPVDLLGQVARLLRPGGVLVLETPNAACDDHLLLGAKWPALNPLEHAFVFDPGALAYALQQAGLRVLELRAPPHESAARRGVVNAWAERPAPVFVTRGEAIEALAGSFAPISALPWPGPRLDPDRPLTRAEAAMLLAAALGLVSSDRGGDAEATLAPPFFADVPAPEGAHPGHPAWRHIHLLRQAGLVSGFGNATFRPDDPLRRSEWEALFARAQAHRR